MSLDDETGFRRFPFCKSKSNDSVNSIEMVLWFPIRGLATESMSNLFHVYVNRHVEQLV